MRIRNVKNAKERWQKSAYIVNEPKIYYGKWNSLFPCNQPIHIEIGMGKGRFIRDLAVANPHINYIGIERFDAILLRATEKVADLALPNLKMILLDAEMLKECFSLNEVSQIYLNFSDPWPKNAHAKRRLTHENFLRLYKDILVDNGLICFKTDNIHLFEFSLESMNNFGMKFKNINLDLHHSDFSGNIMTEYEEKFSVNGPIYRLEAWF